MTKPEQHPEVLRWLALSDEDRLRESIPYKREYEGAYAYFDKPVPVAWEDLTHEQRDKVRQQCIKRSHELDGFMRKELGK